MDLALNSLQMLICHKTQTTNQLTNIDYLINRDTKKFSKKFNIKNKLGKLNRKNAYIIS